MVNNTKHQTLYSFFTVYFNIKTSLVQGAIQNAKNFIILSGLLKK